jgi:hypothetical protein
MTFSSPDDECVHGVATLSCPECITWGDRLRDRWIRIAIVVYDWTGFRLLYWQDRLFAWVRREGRRP